MKDQLMVLILSWQTFSHGNLSLMTNFLSWQTSFHDKLSPITIFLSWQTFSHDNLSFMTNFLSWQSFSHKVISHNNFCHDKLSLTWQTFWHDKLTRDNPPLMTNFLSWQSFSHDELPLMSHDWTICTVGRSTDIMTCVGAARPQFCAHVERVIIRCSSYYWNELLLRSILDLSCCNSFGRPGVDCHLKHDGDYAVIQLMFLINEVRFTFLLTVKTGEYRLQNFILFFSFLYCQDKEYLTVYLEGEEYYPLYRLQNFI